MLSEEIPSMNKHGDNAKIGDLVEVISALGSPTGIYRLVLGVTIKSGTPPGSPRGPTRYLYLEGEDYKIRAANTRIISRARRK